MNILFSTRLKVLELIKWSYRFPPIMLLLSLEWLTNCEHGVQSLLNTWCLVGVRS